MTKADLHFHTDNFLDSNNEPHGIINPKVIAESLYDKSIDYFVALNHYKVGKIVPDIMAEFEEISENNFNDEMGNLRLEYFGEDLSDFKKEFHKKIIGLFGVELNFRFNNRKAHVSYLFKKNDFHTQNLPSTPDKNVNLCVLNEYKKEYPGIAVLNHPTLSLYDEDIYEILTSGLVDGMEIANGEVIRKEDPIKTISAIEIFLKAKEKMPTLAAIGSSDAHRANFIGLAVTQFNHGQNLFEAMESGDTKAIVVNIGRESYKQKKKIIFKEMKKTNAGFDKILGYENQIAY